MWLHFMPHFKTLPEPPPLGAEDGLLRRRDCVAEDAMNIASYNTREDRKVWPLMLAGCGWEGLIWKEAGP